MVKGMGRREKATSRLWVLSLTLPISPGTVALATGFSTMVGLVFGISPAVRASRLNPIDALRCE